MREILFRGKRISTGEWVEGGIYKTFHPNFDCDESGFFERKPNCYCICSNGKDVFVDQNTIGQFTGLTDKNGKKIFEGDIIKSDNGKQSAISVVKHGDYFPEMFYKMLDMFVPGKRHLLAHGFYAVSIGKGEEMILFQSPCVEVIGNIYDNPELLEVQG